MTAKSSAKRPFGLKYAFGCSLRVSYTNGKDKERRRGGLTFFLTPDQILNYIIKTVQVINCHHPANELMTATDDDTVWEWDHPLHSTMSPTTTPPPTISLQPEARLAKINIRLGQIYSTPTDEISFITANTINPPTPQPSRPPPSLSCFGKTNKTWSQWSVRRLLRPPLLLSPKDRHKWQDRQTSPIYTRHLLGHCLWMATWTPSAYQVVSSLPPIWRSFSRVASRG